MKTILWLNPTGRDKRELDRLSHMYHILYHTYATQALRCVCSQKGQRSTMPGCRMPHEEIQYISDVLNDIPIDGVATSRSYPSNIIAAGIAEYHAFPGLSIDQSVTTQHKYFARQVLSQHVPDVNPEYQLLADNDIYRCTLDMPYIVKPVTAAISMGTYYISSHDDMRHVTHMPSPGYFEPMYNAIRHYTTYTCPKECIIAEKHVSGMQVTLDACIYHGDIHILGIVDSHFYPDTLSFYKFTYPSCVPAHIQERMNLYARKIIRAFFLNNTMCNIEFIYHEASDTITFVELNPRMSSQFSSLYEQVDNVNLYHIACHIACNTRPHLPTTQGPHSHAASFALRTTTDYYVATTPPSDDITRICASYPDTRIEICCQSGRYLSELPQDTYTYLYAIINTCGQTEQEAEDTCRHVSNMLPFAFIA